MKPSASPGNSIGEESNSGASSKMNPSPCSVAMSPCMKSSMFTRKVLSPSPG